MIINELRIGNLVNYMGHEIEMSLEIFELINDGTYAKDAFEGILLTEAWLNKFAFDKLPSERPIMYEYYTLSNSHGNFTIKESGNEFLWSDLNTAVFTHHVHKLQNLYNALMGGELKKIIN